MKPSGDPWTASGMLDINKPHEAPVRAFLTRLVNDPENHAKFLNMLAMLEHMGSRKIMVSQTKPGVVMSQETLQHLAEEARHAYFFKRHAERVAKKEMPGWTEENVMARVPALMYFGRMDAGISKTVGDEQAYGWVSLIIELRACWLYGIYNDVVQAENVHLPLGGLLAEEDGHLAEMYEMCGGDDVRMRELSAYETSLFETLWAALEAAYPSAQKQAA